jgi:MFS family permease
MNRPSTTTVDAPLNGWRGALRRGLGSPDAWRARAGALNNSRFRDYWLGTLASFGGNQMQFIAQGWLVYSLTGSALALGGLSAALGVAMVLFSLVGGVLADRLEKRNLIIATQVGSGSIALVLGLLVISGQVAYWHLIVASLGMGAIFALGMPGRQAFVSEIVGESALVNAIALNSAGMNLMRVAAPALAGVLLAVIGVGGIYLLTVGCMAIAVLTTRRVPKSQVKEHGRGSLLNSVSAGLRYVWRQPLILPLIIWSALLGMFGMSYQSLLPVFAEEVFAAGATGYGAMTAVTGLGALAGSLLVASLGDFPQKGVFQAVAALLMAVGLLAFAGLGVFGLSLVALAIVGGCNTAYMSVNNASVQRASEPAMRGRVMSVGMMSFGLMPLGTLPIGAAADFFGAPIAIAASASILLLVTIVVLVVWPRLLRER